ncbi:alpha/beta hydrolase family protein [Glycocaulis sp.]|uniref:alpha/beta hydrolase family protein n=1 Tax=Glycocaulis sp. TaxID=1969725 RepID=UPI003D21ECAD
MLLTISAAVFAAALQAVTPAAGMAQRDWVDEARPHLLDAGASRPVHAVIWYPAADAPETIEIAAGPAQAPVFRFGHAAPGAEPAAGRHPLIVLSHGNGGAAMQMMWLGQKLAEAGYVVVAANHHGNTATEPHLDLRAFAAPWERAIDVHYLIDAMLADPVFGSWIDPERIGVGGFSIGGFTALVAAGARPDFEAYATFCESEARDGTCEPQIETPELRWRSDELQDDPVFAASQERLAALDGDSRIDAVFTIAPALGHAFDQAGLAGLQVPLFVIVGDADPATPAETNGLRIAELTEGASFHLAEGGVSHYSFLAECGPTGLEQVPQYCGDAAGVDRAAIHAQTVALAVDFFDRYLAADR